MKTLAPPDGEDEELQLSGEMTTQVRFGELLGNKRIV